MKILMYSTRSYDKISFREELKNYPNIEIDFTESKLTPQSATMAYGYDAVCSFVNDDLGKDTIEVLALYCKIKLILARCVGTNNIDLETTNKYRIEVKNVPGYSPESVAEHALALLMTVNRHTHKAYNRVRDNNFSLTGLSGYCLNGKTLGLIGYGRIGKCFGNICSGIGMKVLVYDPVFAERNNYSDMTEVTIPGGGYITITTNIDTLYSKSDVISLHLPLTKDTYHMINKKSISKMKDNVILINVSRGGLIDNEALIEANKQCKLFGIGLDVYEGEDDNAFTNHEDDILMNCITSRLLSFPNVVITSHQAFLTDVALEQIAKTTLENAEEYYDKQEVKE